MNIPNTLASVVTASAVLLNMLSGNPMAKETVLASHEMPLNDRYAVESVNDVFKDNILLTMAYMENRIDSPKSIDWTRVEKPFTYDLTLKPNDTFSFHDDVLSEYKNKIAKTTSAHFNATEGFKSDGYLFGDGVCHLASLMYWTAKDAGLNAIAPTKHDFANIPDIPKTYGVAIYNVPGQDSANMQQNLYITNTKLKPIVFHFVYANDTLKMSIKTID